MCARVLAGPPEPCRDYGHLEGVDVSKASTWRVERRARPHADPRERPPGRGRRTCRPGNLQFPVHRGLRPWPFPRGRARAGPARPEGWGSSPTSPRRSAGRRAQWEGGSSGATQALFFFLFFPLRASLVDCQPFPALAMHTSQTMHASQTMHTLQTVQTKPTTKCFGFYCREGVYAYILENSYSSVVYIPTIDL